MGDILKDRTSTYVLNVRLDLGQGDTFLMFQRQIPPAAYWWQNVDLYGRSHLDNNRYCLSESMGRNRKLKSIAKVFIVQPPASYETITCKSEERNRDNVECLIYAYIKQSNCKNDILYVFEKGSGWRNTFSHLLSCVAGSDSEKLLKLYRGCAGDSGNKLVSSHFSTTASATAREKAMFKFIDVIASRARARTLSLPLTDTENTQFRNFGDMESNISVKALRIMIFKMVKRVEIWSKQKVQ